MITSSSYYLSKSFRCYITSFFITACAQNCPPPARTQAVDFDATHQQHVQKRAATQSGSLTVDALFQFIDEHLEMNMTSDQQQVTGFRCLCGFSDFLSRRMCSPV